VQQMCHGSLGSQALADAADVFYAMWRSARNAVEEPYPISRDLLGLPGSPIDNATEHHYRFLDGTYLLHMRVLHLEHCQY